MATQNNPETIYNLAVIAGARWPELVVAQWHLESAKGTKPSGLNNYFGLTGNGTTKETVQYIDGNQVIVKDHFLNFNSLGECVKYLVDRWYLDWREFRGVNRAPSAKAAATLLQQEGYATDPKYAEKLSKLLDQYQNFTQQMNRYASILDAALHFKGLNHQVEALVKLQAMLTEDQKRTFTELWRSDSKGKFPLTVPYFYQRDSKTWQGERMCQSSAIAMRLKQLNPALIEDDDSYIKIVNRFGDTVSQAAHQKALNYLGVNARFEQNGTEQRVYQLLDAGIAVPIGILHRGSISNPSGGGHWVTLIGYNATHFWCHDPFGELDLVHGGHPKNGPTNGKSQLYTKKNLLKRWLIKTKSDGWLWVIT